VRRPNDAPRLSRNGVGLFQGFGLGGFAEQALVHENQFAVVPEELPFAQAALLGCGAGPDPVLNTTNVTAGDTVVIFGAGSVELNAVSGACLAGASRIVVIDISRSDSTRPGASALPTSSTLQKTAAVDVVRDLLPEGADHVFDFVGLKSVAEQGLAMLNVGGGLYLVGVARPDVEIGLNIVSVIDRQKRSRREFRLNQRQARHPHVRRAVPARPDEPR
jgi:S-(hydroxymethyl)glutathione dehydrogenase / alcohol dehydrogenase